MTKLFLLWIAALLLTTALAGAGQATENETLMLVIFFTCKLVWFAYLTLLLEWIARMILTRGWWTWKAPKWEPRRKRITHLKRVGG